MANDIEKPIAIRMDYSDKAKKVYLNVSLGDTPQDDEMMKGQLEWLNDSGFIAEPIMNQANGRQTRKVGSYRIIFPVKENIDEISWYELLEDTVGDDKKQGSKEILNAIFSNIEHDGYTITNKQKQVVESTPELINGAMEALNNANSENVASMVQNFFKHLHTPKVQEMLKSISVIVPNDSGNVNGIGTTEAGSAKAVLSTLALSERNTIWILSQWFNYNRQGTPTIIATDNQWKAIGRQVISNYPLIATMPYRYHGGEYGEAGAEQELGITRNDAYNLDNGVGRAFDRFAGLQANMDGNYTKVVYYDIQDTDIVDPQLWQEFASEANMENISHEFNQKAIDLMSNDEKNSLEQGKEQDTPQPQDNNQEDKPVIEDNAINAQLTVQTITELINGDKRFADTEKIIKTRPNDIANILYSYFSHQEVIDREKDRKKKVAMLEVCTGVVEIELNIALVDVGKKWNDVVRLFDRGTVVAMSNITKPVIDSVRIKQQQYVMRESKNLNEMKEFTFDDFIHDLGLTNQEFDQQMQDNEQAKQMANEQKAIFSNLWNRIIEANNNI